jgi:hypothetical protein
VVLEEDLGPPEEGGLGKRPAGADVHELHLQHLHLASFKEHFASFRERFALFREYFALFREHFASFREHFASLRERFETDLLAALQGLQHPALVPLRLPPVEGTP